MTYQMDSLGWLVAYCPDHLLCIAETSDGVSGKIWFNTSARVNGIVSSMGSFDFLFGVMLGEKILRYANNLICRTSLHRSANRSTSNSGCPFSSQDEQFDKFWQEVCAKANEVEWTIQLCRGVVKHQGEIQWCSQPPQLEGCKINIYLNWYLLII